ncbi:MAG: acyltransferase [Oscillospiraceae bacterium]|nr:acyltransferase [Oscillospiraceae bacterium]
MSIKHRLKLVYQKYIKKMSNSEIIIAHLRRIGTSVGERCYIYSNNLETSEPYLVFIGNDVTIAEGVRFTTHDDSVEAYYRKDTLIVGRITIGNNCFLGSNCIVLPGVTLADKCIVGAGSVITKSFMEEGTVIAGCPAREISKVNDLYRKNEKYIVETSGMDYHRRKEYFLTHPEVLKKV